VNTPVNRTVLLLLSALFLIYGPGILCAETIDSPRFAPVTPEVTAQGGSFTAIAKGYNSLFTNPAGFAKEGGKLTLLSTTATSYFPPTDENGENLQRVLAAEDETGTADALGSLSDLIINNGIGGSARAGIGYVGHNLGLGIVGDLDFYGRGETALGTEIDLVHTWGFIGGMAFPFSLGPLDLYLGGDLRYMMRSQTNDIGIVDFMSSAGGDGESISVASLVGGGLALDAGTIIELGPLALGFALRDIGGTKFDYTLAAGNDFSSALSFEDGAETPEDTYAIPMSANIGIGYHPDFGRLKWLIDPKIHAEYQHLWYAAEKTPSFWTHLHMGTEIRTLKFIKLRAGINQGYLTAGAGVHLFFLDLNFAYFTREMGRYAGVQPNEGISLEAALRF
jgi:hypothetical protein